MTDNFHVQKRYWIKTYVISKKFRILSILQQYSEVMSILNLLTESYVVVNTYDFIYIKDIININGIGFRHLMGFDYIYIT